MANQLEGASGPLMLTRNSDVVMAIGVVGVLIIMVILLLRRYLLYYIILTKNKS